MNMSRHQKIRNYLIKTLQNKGRSVDKHTDRALLKAITKRGDE